MIENHFTHLKMSSEEEYESPQDQRGKNASDEDESPEESDTYE